MRTVSLRGTDLSVSRLCLGTAGFGLTVTQEQAFAQMDLFTDLGGNLIDTAHVYSDWEPGERSRSEKVIGRWLKTRRREDVVLCTKGGHYDFAAPHVSRVTPGQLKKDLSESLEYLGTDYIDVYMLHRDNPALPVYEIMDCLHEFVTSGRVRCLACSNWTAARSAQANAYARANGKTPFAVNELMWSMAQINKEAIPGDYVTMDDAMMRFGLEEGMNFFCFTSLAKGYLTRRCAGLPVSGDLHRTYDNAANERLIEKLRLLESAEAVTHESLRFFERQRVTAVPVVACSSLEQLAQCARAFE